MAHSDFVVLILAAGKGVRLRSTLPKVLHNAGGKPLIEHVVAACRPFKPRDIVAVVGYEADRVSAVLKPLGVRTVLQQPQRGTGHAMMVARRALGSAKFAIVLPGDAPLVRAETLEALARLHRNGGAAATILSAVVADPSGYGRIVRRDDGTVGSIVEDSALTDEQRPVNEINSSIYALTLAKLWPVLSRLRPDNKHRELYLTDAIALLRQQGETVLAQIAADADEVLGCNTRADLAAADSAFRRRKCAALLDAGVTIQLPETVFVDSDVLVGEDTVLEPGVQLLGKTRIGARCTIRTGSILSDTVVADDVLIKPYTVIAEGRLAPHVQVGPFAHFRPGVQMLADSRVGNFVEVKKSTLGEGVKAMHLSYLGDARIGAKSNIGAGTITCNYDGVHKHPTAIGRGVFIGSDSALVAPVRIGNGAYVAAGSVITDNVPADALAIARGKQVNKPGWAAARRRELASAKNHGAKSAARSRKSSAKSASKKKTAAARRLARPSRKRVAPKRQAKHFAKAQARRPAKAKVKRATKRPVRQVARHAAPRSRAALRRR